MAVDTPNFDDLIRAALHQEVDETGGRPGLVLTDWVLVAARSGFDGDSNVTQVVIVPSDSPAYRHRGLLAEAAVRFDADTNALYGDDPA